MDNDIYSKYFAEYPSDMDIDNKVWNELSREFKWTLPCLSKYAERVNWSEVSGNMETLWSAAMLEAFKDRIDWHKLSESGRLCSLTTDDFDKFADRWDWNSLSMNDSLPFSLELLDLYAYRWDWTKIIDNNGVDKAVGLNRAFLERYKNGIPTARIQGSRLGQNFRDERLFKALHVMNPISTEAKEVGINSTNLIPDPYESGRGAFDDDDDYDECCDENLNHNMDNEVWGRLSRYFKWTPPYLSKYAEHVNWSEVSGNTEMVWSAAMLEAFKNRIDWHKLSISGHLCSLTTADFDKFADRWDWYSLSGNRFLPFSLGFLDRYANCWSWAGIIDNNGVDKAVGLNRAFLERYEDRIPPDEIRGSCLWWNIEEERKHKIASQILAADA